MDRERVMGICFQASDRMTLASTQGRTCYCAAMAARSSSFPAASARSKSSNRSWVNIQSAGWITIQSAPTEMYLNEVDRCAIYVGLFGNDYGYEEVQRHRSSGRAGW